MKNFSSHIAIAELTDLAERRVAQDVEFRLLEHVAECHRCSEKLAQLKEVMQMMRTDSSESAPDFAIDNAIALFRSRKKTDSASLVRRVVASLDFDSFDLTPVFGMRSGFSAERQLLFSAGENEIQLQISPAGESWVVSGQVLGSCNAGRVEVRGDDEAVQVALNDLCEFVLPPLSEGRYSMLLLLNGIEVEIPELKIGT